MKVAFLGGGTGGHLAPGIGVAEILRREGHEVLFLVAGRDVELAMLEPRDLPSRQLFGRGGRPKLRALTAWVRATSRWRRALAEEDPDVLVVLGGWVALPAVWTGVGRRPSVLVEPNGRPGKVQRLLSRRVDHVCLAADGPSMPRGRRTTRITGAPSPALDRWRREAAACHFGLDPERRTLLVLGGSQGAADLNALVPDAAELLATATGRWQILHVTGHAAAAVADGPDEPPTTRVPFVHDMGAAWAIADVALCRAGAGTVAELAATGTPAVLVPYPHHADRHQAVNARPLVDAGAAYLVPASDPVGRRTAVPLLARCLDRLDEMGAAARRSARPEASRLVAAIVRAAGNERTLHGVVAAGGS